MGFLQWIRSESCGEMRRLFAGDKSLPRWKRCVVLMGVGLVGNDDGSGVSSSLFLLFALFFEMSMEFRVRDAVFSRSSGHHRQQDP